MSKVTFDYSKACGFVQDHEMQYMSELAEQAKEKLLARTGAGNDFLGWIDLPVDYDKDEFDRIKKAAEKILSRSKSGNRISRTLFCERCIKRSEKISGDLLCRQQYQQYICKRSDRCDRRS